MISQQQKQEFENDKKSVEILLNGDEVKPSSVKQRQIVTKKEVQDKDKEIVRDSRQLKSVFRWKNSFKTYFENQILATPHFEFKSLINR